MSFVEDIYTILKEGTWTNWGNGTRVPNIMKRRIENRGHTPFRGVELENGAIEYHQDHKGTVLYERQTGRIGLWEVNQDNLDNLVADVKAILAAETGESFVLTDGDPDVYTNNYTIDILVERIK